MLAAGVGDASLRATALLRAGRLASVRMDYERAQSLLVESLAIKRAQGDEAGIARRLNAMASVALNRGDNLAVASLCEEAHGILRSLDDEHGIAWALQLLGWAALMDGDLVVGERSLRQAERLHRGISHRTGLTHDLCELTLLRLERGYVAGARAGVVEAVGLVERHLEGMAGNPGWVWSCLMLASAEGRPRSVARLAGVLQAMAGRDVHWSAAARARYQPAVSLAWSELGAEQAARLAAEGAAMPTARVVAEPLADS